MISPTIPEPRFDISAQIRAMRDAAHPKQVVWFSAGTVIPPKPDGVQELMLFTGTLWAVSTAACIALRDDPSDATLARLLGYVEPKRDIRGTPLVVQARSPEGAVITDMVCSQDRRKDASEALRSHGEVVLTTLPWALERRLRLYNAERTAWACSMAAA